MSLVHVSGVRRGSRDRPCDDRLRTRSIPRRCREPGRDERLGICDFCATVRADPIVRLEHGLTTLGAKPVHACGEARRGSATVSPVWIASGGGGGGVRVRVLTRMKTPPACFDGVCRGYEFVTPPTPGAPARVRPTRPRLMRPRLMRPRPPLAPAPPRVSGICCSAVHSTVHAGTRWQRPPSLRHSARSQAAPAAVARASARTGGHCEHTSRSVGERGASASFAMESWRTALVSKPNNKK